MKVAVKAILCFLVFTSCAMCLYAQSLNAGSKEIEQKKLTAKLLVKATANSIKTQPIDKENLYREINENKKKHAQRQKSKRIAREFLEKKINDQLDKELERIFNEFDLSRLDQNYYLEVKSTTIQEASAHIKNNLKNNFPAIFKEVRDKVVEDQRAGLVVYAKPETREDLIKIEKDSPKLHDELMERSMQNYQEEIFSENERFISEKIDEIIEDAKSQMEEQKRIVQNSSGGGSGDITIKSIEMAIRENIKRYQAMLNSAYGIFPSVEKMILPQTRRLTLNKFKAWLDVWDFIVPAERIRRIIENDILTHRNKNESRQNLLAVLESEIPINVFNEYLSTAPAPERQDLKNFLMTNDSFQQQIKMVAQKGLKHFGTVRSKISQEQFQHYFNALANGTWKLQAEEIESRYNTDKNKANVKIAKDFLQGQSIIEETDVLVKEAVKRLAEKGDNSIRGQMALVDAFKKKAEADTENFFEEMSASELNGAPSIEEICKKVTGEIKKEWSENQLSIIYPNLFVMVKDQIKMVIKNLLPLELQRREQVANREERERLQREARARAEKAKLKAKSIEEGGDDGGTEGGDPEKESEEATKLSGTGGRGGSGSGGGGLDGPKPMEKFTPDILIDIDIKNSMKWVQINVKFQDDNEFSFKFPFDIRNPNSFKSTIEEDLKEVKKEFKNYFDEGIKKEGDNTIYIFVGVFHPSVPYGIVFYLREGVRDVLAKFNVKHLKVLWYDGVFFTEDAFKSQFKKIRKKSSSLGAK